MRAPQAAHGPRRLLKRDEAELQDERLAAHARGMTAVTAEGSQVALGLDAVFEGQENALAGPRTAHNAHPRPPHDGGFAVV